MKKKILLVVNPCSGKKKGRKRVEDIVAGLSDGNHEITVRHTVRPGHATQIVAQSGKEYDIIMCCGGDGTFNEVINGAVSLDNTPRLAYIPNGTTNDTANTLSIPGTLPGITQMVKKNYFNKCDIGLFNERHFFCAVSFGFGARASFSTKQSVKNSIGHFAYIISGIEHLSDIKPIKMEIECDGQTISGEFIFGAVINTRSVGGIFKIDEDTFRINDGKFEVVLVRKLNSIIQLPVVLTKLQRQNYDGEQVILLQTNKVKFHSPQKVSWLIDGEHAGDLYDAQIINKKRAVEICCPDSTVFMPTEIYE